MSECLNNVSTMQVTRSLAMSGQKEGALICMRGNDFGRKISLPADTVVVIGRDATACNYAIRDARVSRRHCEIMYIAALEQYRVKDVSRNGTFLGDGKRLGKGKEYLLKPRDSLYMGDEKNYFQLL